MKLVLTGAVLAALLITGVWRYFALQSPPAAPPPTVAADSSASFILPASTDLWTNLTRESTLARIRATPATTATPPPSTPEPAPSINHQIVEARASQLLAQAALESVGLNAEANRHWLAAVTDENLGSNDRRELILALSQAGLGDPLQPGLDDLPTIASRMALLEEAAPHAIDAADAAALQETHRDLQALLSSAAALQNTAAPVSLNADAEPAR